MDINMITVGNLSRPNNYPVPGGDPKDKFREEPLT
jgi:hypothetical protein